MFYFNLFLALLFIGALPFSWIYDKNFEDTKIELAQEKQRTENTVENNIKDIVRELNKIPLHRRGSVMVTEEGTIHVQVFEAEPFN